MAMLEVKDLEVYYGMIQAIKGISFEVNQGEVIALIGATVPERQQRFIRLQDFFLRRKEVFFLKDRTLQKCLHIRSYPWEWLMCRKDVEYSRSLAYMRI